MITGSWPLAAKLCLSFASTIEVTSYNNMEYNVAECNYGISNLGDDGCCWVLIRRGN